MADTVKNNQTVRPISMKEAKQYMTAFDRHIASSTTGKYTLEQGQPCNAIISLFNDGAILFTLFNSGWQRLGFRYIDGDVEDDNDK